MSEQHSSTSVPPDEDDAVHMATEGIPGREPAPDPSAFDDSVEADDDEAGDA